jgi:protein-disulfide isomerase
MEKESKKNSVNEKKMKNLVSATILLAGLFVGSLFVDVSQLVKGGGYSMKNLNKSDIFEAGGKTWVAYDEPAVGAKVINDDACEKCDVSEAIVWLRRVLPTVSTEKVAYDSAEGKTLIEKFGIKTLPAFIFDGSIANTEFYVQAKVLFSEKEGSQVLNTQELGLPAGKYLATPEAKEGDAIFGKEDSEAKVFIFSDYQCPYCKVFYSSLRDIMKEYGDRVAFNYKHLPLDEIHPQATNASLAAACAQEQGKFWEYSDKLYTSQTEWSATKDVAKFKQYAVALGLKSVDFNKCLDDKKYTEKIETDKQEGADFGITGTPAIFVGDQFSSGAISVDDLKGQIESLLNKGE